MPLLTTTALDLIQMKIICVNGSSEEVEDCISSIDSILAPPTTWIRASSSLIIYYSISQHSFNESVNDVASSLAGQTLHGDCVVVNDTMCWADGLPTGMLFLIASCLDSNASSMLPLLGVNRSWRQELINDHRYLQAIRFQLRNPWNPLDSSQKGTSKPTTTPSEDTEKRMGKRLIFGFSKLHLSLRKKRTMMIPPSILSLASKAGNVGSAAVLAVFYDAAGDCDEAAKWWAKAARGGDIEGLFRHGCHLYSSDQAEDAASYLSKAMKTVLGVDSLSQAPPIAPGVSEDSALCELLSRASLILGYMHLDGHGVKADNEIAVKLFKLAGCNEGQRALGWLYNTGQF